ncbi:MAG: hypothetical protein H6Q06_332 [Acidobacteria bacterium]|nr:hypothetical protein [Acidobacteriota bacterium]
MVGTRVRKGAGAAGSCSITNQQTACIFSRIIYSTVGPQLSHSVFCVLNS